MSNIPEQLEKIEENINEAETILQDLKQKPRTENITEQIEHFESMLNKLNGLKESYIQLSQKFQSTSSVPSSFSNNSNQNNVINSDRKIGGAVSNPSVLSIRNVLSSFDNLDQLKHQEQPKRNETNNSSHMKSLEIEVPNDSELSHSFTFGDSKHKSSSFKNMDTLFYIHILSHHIEIGTKMIDILDKIEFNDSIKKGLHLLKEVVIKLKELRERFQFIENAKQTFQCQSSLVENGSLSSEMEAFTSVSDDLLENFTTGVKCFKSAMDIIQSYLDPKLIEIDDGNTEDNESSLNQNPSDALRILNSIINNRVSDQTNNNNNDDGLNGESTQNTKNDNSSNINNTEAIFNLNLENQASSQPDGDSLVNNDDENKDKAINDDKEDLSCHEKDQDESMELGIGSIPNTSGSILHEASNIVPTTSKNHDKDYSDENNDSDNKLMEDADDVDNIAVMVQLKKQTEIEKNEIMRLLEEKRNMQLKLAELKKAKETAQNQMISLTKSTSNAESRLNATGNSYILNNDNDLQNGNEDDEDDDNDDILDDANDGNNHDGDDEEDEVEELENEEEDGDDDDIFGASSTEPGSTFTNLFSQKTGSLVNEMESLFKLLSDVKMDGFMPRDNSGPFARLSSANISQMNNKDDVTSPSLSGLMQSRQQLNGIGQMPSLFSGLSSSLLSTMSLPIMENGGSYVSPQLHQNTSTESTQASQAAMGATSSATRLYGEFTQKANELKQKQLQIQQLQDMLNKIKQDSMILGESMLNNPNSNGEEDEEENDEDDGNGIGHDAEDDGVINGGTRNQKGRDSVTFQEPVATFIANEELYENMREQRMIREEMRDRHAINRQQKLCKENTNTTCTNTTSISPNGVAMSRNGTEIRAGNSLNDSGSNNPSNPSNTCIPGAPPEVLSEPVGIRSNSYKVRPTNSTSTNASRLNHHANHHDTASQDRTTAATWGSSSAGGDDDEEDEFRDDTDNPIPTQVTNSKPEDLSCSNRSISNQTTVLQGNHTSPTAHNMRIRGYNLVNNSTNTTPNVLNSTTTQQGFGVDENSRVAPIGQSASFRNNTKSNTRNINPGQVQQHLDSKQNDKTRSGSNNDISQLKSQLDSITSMCRNMALEQNRLSRDIIELKHGSGVIRNPTNPVNLPPIMGHMSEDERGNIVTSTHAIPSSNVGGSVQPPTQSHHGFIPPPNFDALAGSVQNNLCTLDSLAATSTAPISAGIASANWDEASLGGASSTLGTGLVGRNFVPYFYNGNGPSIQAAHVVSPYQSMLQQQNIMMQNYTMFMKLQMSLISTQLEQQQRLINSSCYPPTPTPQAYISAPLLHQSQPMNSIPPYFPGTTGSISSSTRGSNTYYPPPGPLEGHSSLMHNHHNTLTNGSSGLILGSAPPNNNPNNNADSDYPIIFDNQNSNQSNGVPPLVQPHQQSFYNDIVHPIEPNNGSAWKPANSTNRSIHRN